MCTQTIISNSLIQIMSTPSRSRLSTLQVDSADSQRLGTESCSRSKANNVHRKTSKVRAKSTVTPPNGKFLISSFSVTQRFYLLLTIIHFDAPSNESSSQSAHIRGLLFQGIYYQKKKRNFLFIRFPLSMKGSRDRLVSNRFTIEGRS